MSLVQDPQLARIAELEAENARLKAALASAEDFRAMVDSVDQMIWSTRADGFHDYYNRRWYEYTGMPEGSTDGEEWNGVFHPDDQERAWEVWRRCLASGETYHIEYRLRHRSGQYRWVLGRAQPVRDDAGEITRWYGTCTDIHDLKAAEAALRASEAQMRMVADSMPVLISYVDREHRYRFINKAYERTFGRSTDALIGKHVRDVIGEEAFAALDPTVTRVLAGERVAVELQLPLPGGSRHVAIDYVPDRRGDQVLGYFALAQDITERKESEARLRESEARFRAMADSAPVPAWVTNDQGIEFVNRALSEFAGLAPDEMLGPVWISLIHPDDLDQVQQIRTEAWAKGEPYKFEARFRRADGAWRWLLVSSRPREDMGAGGRGYVGMAVDLTDMHEANEALRESQSRLQTLVSNLPGVLVYQVVTSRDMSERQYVYVSSNAESVVGVPAETAMADPTALMGRINPDELQGVVAAEIEAARHLRKLDIELTGHTPWRGHLRTRIISQPRELPDGRLAWDGIVIDITERKQVEDALRASEDRLRLATEAASVGVWDFNPQTGELSWDVGTRAAFGLSPDARVDYDVFLNALHPDDRAAADAAVQQAMDPDGPGDYAVEYRAIGIEDGVERWIDARGRAIFQNKRAVRFIGTVIDITARKEAAAALARSEVALREQTRSLETLNAIATNLAGELDLEKVVQMVTDAGVAMSGAQFGAFFYNVLNSAGESYMLYTISGVDRSEFDKFPMPRNTAIFHPTFSGEGPVRSDDITKDPRYGKSEPHYGMPEGHLPVRSYLAAPVRSRTGEVVGGLFFGHEQPGIFTERHERLLIGIAGQAAVAIDNARLFEAAQREIVERRRAQEALAELNRSLEQRVAAAIAERERMEEALRQSQKMEAVGQLTGGIAHDFNNLLTVITGNLELAQRQTVGLGNARLDRNIGGALTGAERAAVLTQRLLAFSRRQPLTPKPIDANKLVAGMSELLHRSLGETIAVETVLGPDLWRIEIDPNQLENAILNLALNARDAMEQGGQLIIETKNIQIGEGDGGENGELAAGDYVAISVSDTGIGMSEETLARAYEPFFTTKEVGKGTGLGLSMVYGFVRQSGGHLKIESEVGQGTSVRLFLPRLVADAQAEEAAQAPVVPEGSAQETILVCEDDHDVRAYTVEVLRELGYRVLEAPDGPSALRILESKDGEVDLLFTDVVLPTGMNGEMLAEQARRLRPGLKVLFTTGYARNAMMHDGRLDPGVELITKPFAYAELAARVRDMLDAPV